VHYICDLGLFRYTPQHPWIENITSILGNLVNVMRYSCTQAFNFSFKDSIKHHLFGDPSSNIWKKSKNYQKLGKNIISGGVAGSCSLTFVYSLDYCRTRLANDVMSGTGEKRKFNGIIDVYVKTIRSDGIRGLYRGFGISCFGIFIYRGLYFGLYDSLKPIVLKENESNFTLCFILGWFVTCLAGIIDYPIDTVRRRMMMTSGETLKYRNSIDCAIQIIKLEGFKAMMKGASANILRTAAGAGVLAGSDKLKELYFSHKFRLKT